MRRPSLRSGEFHVRSARLGSLTLARSSMSARLAFGCASPGLRLAASLRSGDLHIRSARLRLRLARLPCLEALGEATLTPAMTGRRIRISAGSVTAEAVLNDSTTALAVWEALPLAAAGETWGDEIYFSIPVKARPEAPRETVEMGDLGYWPPGSAFCIFFGPTPASRGSEIRPASAGNVFGRMLGDATRFRKVRSGTTVRIERAWRPAAARHRRSA